MVKRKVRRRASKMTLFQLSWFIIKKNPILFLPNILMLVSNLIIFLCLIKITGVSSAILSNDYLGLKESMLSGGFFIAIVVYFVLTFVIDNYFITAKYGLIKKVLTKGNAKLSDGIKFAKKHYFTTLGIHIMSSLILFIPVVLLAVFIFFILPFSKLVAMTLFLPLAIVYLFYVGVRLIFIYPVMTFEKKGAYNSLRGDFHFVKTHLHHAFLTWLIVIGVSIFLSIFKENVVNLGSILHQQITLLAVLLVIIILVIEIAVSAWEHVFIFKSYLVAKKKR